jgi:lipid-binding SYLF domain-containing protein
MRKIGLSIGLFFAGAALAADAPERLPVAATVLKEIMGTPDKSIPQELLNKAVCVVVVPGVKKGAFIWGGKYGRGFVTCRRKSGAGWGAPGSVRIEGGSFGLQIGGSETDVVMLVMNERGMDRLLSSKFTIGGDAAAAAGPVGRTGEAQTDALLSAELLTWSRSRGLFAGISLNGSTMREDKDWNKQLYGKVLTNREILTTETNPPKEAGELLAELNRYSSRK